MSTNPKLILFTAPALALLDALGENVNKTSVINDAIIAQLGQGEEAARAKLRILLALTEPKE